MDLLVIRHAAAVARRDRLADAARPLTAAGLRRWREAARGLGRLGVRLDLLLHSPWLRAMQTAEELAPLVDGETVVTPHLAAPPGEALLAEIAAGGARVAVVGHEPWLGALCATLLLGRDGDQTELELGKGTVAWLRGEPRPRGMSLVALLPARVLARVRRG